MLEPADHPAKHARGASLSRRQLLQIGGVCALGGGLAGTARWLRRQERGWQADVFIASAAGYGADLVATLAAALEELDLTRRDIHGKRVLLKPNQPRQCT